MKMRFSISVALSLMMAPPSAFASSSASSSIITTKLDFMNAMRDSQIQTSSNDRKLRLQKSILAAAIPSNSDRSLYYNNTDDQATDDQATDDYDDYGFDVSSYSLKYAGCSSVSAFSDDMAENEDSTTVFETDQYAVFRFCPSDSCSDTSTYGCTDNYGEYMVPLYTWLTIVAEYRAEEFERYCEYCDACYGSNDDANANADDGNNGNRNRNRNLADDDGAAQGSNCAYESACTGYNDLCNNDDYGKTDWTQFFGCKEWQYDADEELSFYIGPHCASDKTSIVIGTFEDDACAVYEGEKYDLATITGLPFTSDALMEYYESDCIPCKESSLAFSNSANDNDDAADTLTETCETLYGYAAKCNRHIGGASSASYQSYQQEDNEYAVCSFIASVVTGTYDEYGYIYVDTSRFEADNKYNQYTQSAARKGIVTGSQTFGLVSFSLLIVGMGVYSALLQRQIKQKAAFVNNHAEPLGVGRQNSGIMMARSTTVDSTYRAPTSPAGAMA